VLKVAEQSNLDVTAQRLQRRFVALRRRALGLDVLLGAALVGFLATLGIVLTGWSVAFSAVYGMIMAGALAVFLLLARRIRIPVLAVLISADRRLRLQERLSTAYEYLQQHAHNRFVPSLAAEAERVAPQVDTRVVFPTRLPRRLWGIPLFVAATVALFRLEVAPLRFDDMAQQDVAPEIAREGKRLEQWGQRLEQLAQQERLDRSLILARHMQDLGRRLQREGVEKAQVTQRISTLSQYLQRMQQELQERTLMSEAGLTSTQDVLVSGKSIKQELQDILQLLQQEALPREMVSVAEQGLLRLGRQVGQHPELERLVQSLRVGNVEAAKQLLQDLLQQQQSAEELEHLERARRALEYSSRTLQRGAPGETSGSGTSDPSDTPNGDISTERQDGMMAEDMSDMDDFGAPGMEEGMGTSRYTREDTARHLRESEQPASQVPVRSGEGAMRLGYMRYLPIQNEVREPLEKVVVRYQQAAEEVLTQEQVPRDYREQIKHYFLAIGMVPEANKQ
jgi:hypothetical protein